MLVIAVTRAAKNFRWASPREDEGFAAVMEGLRCIKGVCAKKKLAMIAEHVQAIMEMQRPPGMLMEKWALMKAVLVVGWMAFLRVSEMVGSGMERGQLKEGPSGLDVCDAVFMNEPKSRGRLDLRVQSTKNDPERAVETTVVYDDELGGGLCAIKKLNMWMAMAHLEVQKGCTKGASGCKQCCMRRRACLQLQDLWQAVQGCGAWESERQAAVKTGAEWDAKRAVL